MAGQRLHRQPGGFSRERASGTGPGGAPLATGGAGRSLVAPSLSLTATSFSQQLRLAAARRDGDAGKVAVTAGDRGRGMRVLPRLRQPTGRSGGGRWSSRINQSLII